jgi:hypothetical protein
MEVVMSNKITGKEAKCYQFQIDNRGLEQTYLVLEGTNNYIDIDPWDLVENAIENCGFKEKDEAKFIELLRKLKQRVSETKVE